MKLIHIPGFLVIVVFVVVRTRIIELHYRLIGLSFLATAQTAEKMDKILQRTFSLICPPGVREFAA